MLLQCRYLRPITVKSQGKLSFCRVLLETESATGRFEPQRRIRAALVRDSLERILATSTTHFSITATGEQFKMKYRDRFVCAIAAFLAYCALVGYNQTCVAQTTTGLSVTASDDAEFLGRTLFPGSEENLFRFDGAFLDFGLEGLPLGEDGLPVGEPEEAAGPRASIGTFVNSSAVYGIGDSENTVAAGIAISSGLVENYGGGANFSGGTSGFFSDFQFDDETGAISGTSGPTANAAQTDLLDEISPSALGNFQDTTSLNITFTNVTQTDQVLDLFAVFGTEETPTFVGTNFNDGFGVFLNGENIALQGGLPLNVDHPDQTPVFGTELDTLITGSDDAGGARLPYIDLTTTVGAGQHELTIVLGDGSDDQLDSTAFLSRDVSDQLVESVALLPNTINQEGGFQFEDITLDAGEQLFIDPDIAIGYEYSVEQSASATEAIFDSVRVDPAGFDINFTLSYEDQDGTELFETITAGQVFVFPAEAEVSSFRITDIDSFDNLSPDDPLAFATLLTFRNDLLNATVVQTPISIAAIPEPSSSVLLLVGLSTAFLRRRR